MKKLHLIIFILFIFSCNNSATESIDSIDATPTSSTLKETISSEESLSLELEIKETLEDIEIKQSVFSLSNDLTLKKFQLLSGFSYGINAIYPGSGYIDFHNENIIILSSRGILAFREELIDDSKNFKQIRNNIDDFIDLNQYRKNKWFSLKDLHIFNEKIFISFTEEIKEDCWNTSVIYGSIDYEFIDFKKLFSLKECIHSITNIDKEFNAHQSGGRIISFNEEFIFLSIGDYRSRSLAQEAQSNNGKIVKISVTTGDYEIVSMGHRNPQGLYFDKENNFILETEHGPQGGDEINLIEINQANESAIQNYGWPISSEGEHYGGRTEENVEKYEKYPLHNSHIEYGFIEPIMSFVPSIGISEIVKISPNKYVVSSMKDKSLYFFEFNKQMELNNLDRVEVSERVRDMRYNKNKLYLFLEDTASIGVINLD